MKLTNRQKRATLLDGHTSISACPGSGKTRTLTAKILRVGEEIEGTPKKICCITYTNAAVYEIERRVSQYGKSKILDSCDISTIHGFCLNNILRKFYWKLRSLQNGFTISAPDSQLYQDCANEVIQEYGLKKSVLSYFEQINIDEKGNPLTPFNISAEAAFSFWKKLENNNSIDFPNVIYKSYKILSESPSLARALSSKYSWYLIDEFQDTTDLQIELFKLIYKNQRSKFFVVGDENQSIFSFAGAKSSNLGNFTHFIKANSSTTLNENFRSSHLITDLSNTLISSNNGPMIALGEHKNFGVKVDYIHSHNINDDIHSKFLKNVEDLKINFENVAILAPWWPDLLHLGRFLRDTGYSITGPGSRPYKRKHLIVPVLEQACACLYDKGYKHIYMLEKEVVDLINNLQGRHLAFSYFERKILVKKIIRTSRMTKESTENAGDWITLFSQRLSKALSSGGWIEKSKSSLLIESSNAIKRDMLENNTDPNLLGLEDFSVFSSYRNSINLLTLHRSKGREFDAVAIINVNEGRMPHFSSTSTEEIEESKRLLYVGMTRAKKYLMLLSDASDSRNGASRFLTDLLNTNYINIL